MRNIKNNNAEEQMSCYWGIAICDLIWGKQGFERWPNPFVLNWFVLKRPSSRAQKTPFRWLTVPGASTNKETSAQVFGLQKRACAPTSTVTGIRPSKRLESAIPSPRDGHGASSMNFWLLSCTLQSRSYKWTISPWESPRICTWKRRINSEQADHSQAKQKLE